MPEIQRVPASTTLREVAATQETVLTGQNEFKESSTEYSVSVVPNEINGALTERTKLTVANMYNESNFYKNPDGTGM